MSANLYESDFFGWPRRQSELPRTGRFEEVDTEHPIEEIEAMGRSERQQLTRRLEILLTHLLQWRYQPDFRGRSGQPDHHRTAPSYRQTAGRQPYSASQA